VRQLQERLTRILPRVTLLPSAQDGHEALRRIRDYSPDLLLLDLDMPRMDGLTTLRALGRRRSMTTIAVATESLEGGRAVWEALALGADDFITKRTIRSSGADEESCERMDGRLRDVLEPLVAPVKPTPGVLHPSPVTEEEVARLVALVFLVETRHLRRIANLLAQPGSRFPVPIVLQIDHPPRFTRAIHEGLDRLATMPVRVAVDGERLAPGQVVLVPGRCQGELAGEPDDLRLEFLPVTDWGSPVEKRLRMLRPFLDRNDAPIGVVVADPLPMEILLVAGEAAAQRRLFCLSAGQGTEADSLLRIVDTLCAGDLSGTPS
jgi:chemotaxis response regulator CheB